MAKIYLKKVKVKDKYVDTCDGCYYYRGGECYDVQYLECAGFIYKQVEAPNV